jgi:F-type H+-transporting ATPase subunit c
MKLRKALLAIGLFMMTFGATAAMAADDAATGGNSGAMAAALAIAIAAFGGAIGQGMIGKSALEGISRNPAAQNKIFVPMIIALALVESLVLYAFVIAFVKT